MVDAPGRAKPRFPADKVPIAEREIETLVDRLGADARDLALTQGAAGGDLLFAEACVRRGVHLQLLLPLPEDEFIAQSILPSVDGERWRERYLALKTQLGEPPQVLPDPTQASTTSMNVFERCNRVAAVERICARAAQGAPDLSVGRRRRRWARRHRAHGRRSQAPRRSGELARHEAIVVTDPVAGRAAAAGELAQAFRTDVFISYARTNRDVAAQVAEAFEAQGLLVWWDRELHAGSEFAEVIETQLQNAHVVVALWSADSVRSGFVRDESGRALRAGKLLPVRIEDVDLPLGFGQLHTLDLLDWDGDAGDEAFRQLVLEVKRMKAQPAVGDAGDAASSRAAAFGRWRLPRYALAVLIAGALAVLGYGGKVMWNKDQADTYFRSGLATSTRASRGW